jgi:hypothetical protein
MKKNQVVILSLYSNARGLGYVCLESPQNLKESGVLTIRPICNGRILERITKFVDFFKPKVIIVKDFENNYSRQNKRAVALAESIANYAKEVKVPVYRYTRQQIRDVFEQFGAKSKYEIAQKIISWFPQLEPRAPKIRKPWMAEDYHMGEFDAISLAVTHQYLTG